MHSKKVKPWSIFEECNFLNEGGIAHFCFNDSFLEGTFLTQIFREQKEKKSKIFSLFGKEINADWLEAHLYDLNLFGDFDSYVFLDAQGMSAKVLKFFEQRPLQLMAGQLLLLCYSKKESMEKAVKSIGGISYLVESAKFWEGEKLLYLAEKLQAVDLPVAVEKAIIDRLEINFADYYQVVSLIKLNFERAANIELDQVLALIEGQKLNHFELANLYGHRRFHDFLQRVLVFADDFESLREIFQFMQGHLIKMHDPQYILLKARPSTYDLDIQKTVHLWKSSDLIRSIELFGQLEIEAKKKSNFLKPRLCRDLLFTELR